MTVSNVVISSELESVIEILSKWKESVDRGIPGADVPGDADNHYEMYMHNLCGEMMLAATKIEGLVEAINMYL